MSGEFAPSGASGKILTNAVAGILAVDSGRTTLDDWLDRSAPPEMRRTLAHLLLTVYRRKVFLEGVLGRFCSRPPRPELHALLLTAMAQAAFQSAIAPESAANVAVSVASAREKGFVNAILRRFLREKPQPGTTPEEVLPPAVCARWKKRFSPEVLNGFAELFLREAEFTFRMERDYEPEFPCEAVASPGKFRFFRAAEPGTVLASGSFRQGKCYIQDPAASMAPSLADEGAEQILDLCAAPGGKTLMLAELAAPGAKITAADVSARRQEQTRANFALRKLPAEVLVSGPEGISGEYDLVLADVPCSNTGVFRRRPDALHRFTGETLLRAATLQKKILEAAAPRVRQGGSLLYSTCSIEEEEDAMQVQGFLERHPEFQLAEERLLLPSLEHDGAYAAKLIRR